MKRTFVLSHEQARERALECVRTAPDGFSVVVGPPTRTLEENALLHAILSEISRQVIWDSAYQDVETWKRMLTAGWCRATGRPMKILTAVDGHGIDLVPVKTSNLSKSDCAELIDYILAWGADKGVEFAMDCTA